MNSRQTFFFAKEYNKAHLHKPTRAFRHTVCQLLTSMLCTVAFENYWVLHQNICSG